MSTSTSEPVMPSAILWLIGFIGDRGIVRRRDVVIAATNVKRKPWLTSSIERYLTTQNHYGHVETPGYFWRKRKAYFKRVSRGQYTLTERGWVRYFYEVCGERT